MRTMWLTLAAMNFLAAFATDNGWLAVAGVGCLANVALEMWLAARGETE